MKRIALIAIIAISTIVLGGWRQGSSNNFLLDGSSVILTTVAGDQIAGN